MRRSKRQKLIFFLLFIFYFFLFVIYLFIRTDTSLTSEVLSEEELVAQSIRRATGSKGSNASTFVAPYEKTVIFEPISDPCQGTGDGVYLILMVISSPGNKNARNAVRYNLKAGVNEYNERRWDSHTKRNNTLLFFTGVSTDPNIQSKLEEEANTYGDIVIDNVLDTYLNLTVKVLRMFKWVRASCPQAKFVLKIDDDVYLNLLKLLDYLSKISLYPSDAQNLIGGYRYKDQSPVRTIHSEYGKWFAPIDVWPHEKYPDFIGGPGYILGMKAVDKIYTASLSTPLFHLEDVFITGIVGNSILRMKLSMIPGIVTDWNSLTSLFYSSCYVQDKVIIHTLKPQELKCWKHMNNKNFICSYWPIFISTLFC